MRTCILFLLVAPFRWPCLVSHFRSPLCQLGVYSACLNFLHVFLPSFENFSLSLRESFFRFQFHYTMLLTSHIYSFGWLLQASLDFCYFPYIFFLSLVPSYQDSPIDYLFHPRHMDNNPILVRWLSIPSPPTITPLSIVVHFLLDFSSLDYWSILALRLLLHKECKLFMPCWIKAMCIVLWLLRFLIGPQDATPTQQAT